MISNMNGQKRFPTQIVKNDFQYIYSQIRQIITLVEFL